MWEDIGGRTRKALDAADPVYRRWLIKEARARRYLGFVAENPEGRVVASGCLWLQPAQPRPGVPRQTDPYLLSMYTEPGHRGKGLATAIVREAIRWCRGRGYARMTLHASKMGRGMYRRLGYERTWEMRLRLTPRPKRSAARRGARRSG
jgi:GNAT superfamily N-acetyltransferase